MRYRSILMAVAAGLTLAFASPAVAAPPTAKPVPFLAVDAAYKQFVSARGAFVQFRAFARPDLVRWSIDVVRYRRLSRTVVDWRTTMTLDVAGAEPGQYVPAERAALWIRVRRFRDTKGVVRTRWSDAHGGTLFQRTPITTLVPPAPPTPPPAGAGN
jgi:hypothetical protein